MVIGLTPKQRRFAQLRVEGHSKYEAHCRAGYAHKKGKKSTYERHAQRTEDLPAVRDEIARLNALHEKRHKVTIDSLLEELEQARQVAIEKLDSSAMTRATMGKARVTGLDKKVIEVGSKEIGIVINRAES